VLGNPRRFSSLGGPEHRLGPVHVREDRSNRALDDETYADGGREVKDHVRGADQLVQYLVVFDRATTMRKRG